MIETMALPMYQVLENISPDLLEAMYVSMLRIREAEERLADLVAAGEVKCPCHLYSGEEAVAVGVCSALSPNDYVFGSHRSHGHYLAKGGSLKALFAEIYGKETGCSRGRGGSMHLIDVESNMMGSAPIVAGTIALALGAALASKIRNDGRVSVSFFGDGASGEGVLCESLNFAALKKLPIIFVCENNLYSTHLPISEIRVSQKIYELAKPFGIKSFRVDGNDVLRVYECACKAVEQCREGNGPVFVECLTYRLRGHVGPDDNIQGAHTDIRPKDEIEKWRKKDPLIRFEQYLRKNNIFSSDRWAEIKQSVTTEVEEAYSYSVNSPYPPREDLQDYVFATQTTDL
jgi:TPP-dependent pyruvate/acetoin dehydrogenase alpha subunit